MLTRKTSPPRRQSLLRSYVTSNTARVRHRSVFRFARKASAAHSSQWDGASVSHAPNSLCRLRRVGCALHRAEALRCARVPIVSRLSGLSLASPATVLIVRGQLARPRPRREVCRGPRPRPLAVLAALRGVDSSEAPSASRGAAWPRVGGIAGVFKNSVACVECRTSTACRHASACCLALWISRAVQS